MSHVDVDSLEEIVFHFRDGEPWATGVLRSALEEHGDEIVRQLRAAPQLLEACKAALEHIRKLPRPTTIDKRLTREQLVGILDAAVQSAEEGGA